jgi:hypothetical protein
MKEENTENSLHKEMKDMTAYIFTFIKCYHVRAIEYTIITLPVNIRERESLSLSLSLIHV